MLQRLRADRGFADQKLYALLRELGFEYVVRFRQCITVTDAQGELKGACVTAEKALYRKRFTIEERFRDVKDIRFGMGLSSVRIAERDRLLLVSARPAPC